MKVKVGLIILVLAGFMSVVLTVNSMGEQEKYDEVYYDAIESHYMDEVRSVLREHSYFFSGVTITKITDESGNRSYQVNINDSGFENMDTDEKEMLLGRLAAIKFADTKAKISHALMNQTAE